MSQDKDGGRYKCGLSLLTVGYAKVRIIAWELADKIVANQCADCVYWLWALSRSQRQYVWTVTADNAFRGDQCDCMWNLCQERGADCGNRPWVLTRQYHSTWSLCHKIQWPDVASAKSISVQGEWLWQSWSATSEPAETPQLRVTPRPASILCFALHTALWLQFLLTLSVSYFKQTLWRCGQLWP